MNNFKKIVLVLAATLSSNVAIADSVRIVAKPTEAKSMQKSSIAGQRNLRASKLETLSVSQNEAIDKMAEMRASGKYDYVELDVVVSNGRQNKRPADFTASPLSLNPTTYNDTYYNEQVYFLDSESHGAGLGITSAQSLVVPYRPMSVGVVDGGFMEAITDVDMSNGATFFEVDGIVVENSHLVTPGGVCEESGHGSGVASVIGAIRNNNKGLAGIADVEIVAAQALLCGSGYLSDISKAVTWLAGGEVEGIETRETPVDVINLSVGADVGFCPQFMSEAINYAHSKNVVIVASSGNDFVSAENNAPSLCDNVIGVGALGYDSTDPYNSTRDISYFSNYGDSIDISTQGEWIVGVATDDTQAHFWDGTSFSAPIVSGVAAMIKQLLPNANTDDVLDIMALTSTAFDANSECATLGCGAGALNAIAAVEMAKQISENGNYATLTPVLASGEFCSEKVYFANNGAISRLCEMFEFAPLFNDDASTTYNIYELSSTENSTLSFDLPQDAVLVAESIEVGSSLTDINTGAPYAFVKCINGQCETKAFSLNVDASGKPAECGNLKSMPSN